LCRPRQFPFTAIAQTHRVARRAARLDEAAIAALRRRGGLSEDAHPELHLSPALGSPAARRALEAPLFSPPPVLAAAASPAAALPAAASPALASALVTPLESPAMRRRGGARPAPEKLELEW
jgi:hypothetical protein